MNKLTKLRWGMLGLALAVVSGGSFVMATENAEQPNLDPQLVLVTEGGEQSQDAIEQIEEQVKNDGCCFFEKVKTSVSEYYGWSKDSASYCYDWSKEKAEEGVSRWKGYYEEAPVKTVAVSVAVPVAASVVVYSLCKGTSWLFGKLGLKSKAKSE